MVNDPQPTGEFNAEQVADVPEVTGPLQATQTTDPASTFDNSLPQIAGYRISGEVARGGMGCVLNGIELMLEREVAIKILLPGTNSERFISESKITAKLPHPNIPPIYALGTLDDG